MSVPEQTNYPLTLTVTPGPQLQLKLLLPPRRASTRRPSPTCSSELCGLLSEAPRLEAQRVSRLLHWLPQASRRAVRASVPGRAAAGPRKRCAAGERARAHASPPIWQELFQVDRVGIDVNFFDLGGHSLLLLRAHKRLRATWTATSRSSPLVALPDRARPGPLLWR